MPVVPRLRPLAAAWALVLLEAVAMAGLAAVVLVDLVLGLVRGTGRGSIGPALFLAGCALGVGALLAAGARALAAGRRWARGPVLTCQVLLVVVTVGWATSGVAPAWVLALTALGVAVAVLLLVPSVVRATTATDRDPG